MRIRAATVADVPRLVALGASFITQTAYRTLLPVNGDQIAGLLERLIADAQGVVFVLERDDVVIGMIGMYGFVHPISGERVASEVFWWVEPDVRGSGLKLL